MPWYHQVATFLNDALSQFRATRRANLALSCENTYPCPVLDTG